MNFERINEYAIKMIPHYLVAAAWSTSGTSPEGGELGSLEDYEFSEDAKALALIDCTYFVRVAFPWLEPACNDSEDEPIPIIAPEMAGHDLWLTRCGHGVGFWDRGYTYGDVLTRICEKMGNIDPYINDSGAIEFG
jgi:hypothetical protein